MYRQSPGRIQRSKGIKVKHVLQSSLLLAICFWLIYQVKHSHDKKREFDESDARSLLQRESSDGFVKLGRKGIGVHLEGTLSKNVKHDEPEEEEEEAAGEMGETKSEDELEGMKAEGKTGEDDEIDEDEHGKLDEVDKEEDVVDGEEREDAVEDETQEIEAENAHHGQSEKEISVEESDHDDNEIDEAREEHYKADDASSAVTHNTQVAAAENEDEWLENSKENNSEGANEGEKRRGLVVGASEMTGDDHHTNTTTLVTKEGVLDKSQNISSPNNTVTKEFNSSHLMSNSSPEVAENRDLMTQNVTENKPELDSNSAIPTTNGTSAEVSHFKINTLDPENNNSIVNGFNSTDSGEPKESELHSEHFSNPSDNIKEYSASENITKLENWANEGSSSKSNDNESLAIQNDEIKNGNTNTNNGTDAVLESTVAQNHTDYEHNPFEALVEKGLHKDLDTKDDGVVE